MAFSTVRTFFSEHHQGYISPIHILSLPVVPQRDPDVSEEDRQRFGDILASSEKLQSNTVIFYGLATTRINHDKTSLLTRASLTLKRPVCLLQCGNLLEKFIGETEKNLNRLMAEAESNNWILFFDEADALFTSRADSQSEQNKKRQDEAGHLLDIILRHNGLLILSIAEKEVLAKLKSRLKHCIVLH